MNHQIESKPEPVTAARSFYFVVTRHVLPLFLCFVGLGVLAPLVVCDKLRCDLLKYFRGRFDDVQLLLVSLPVLLFLTCIGIVSLGRQARWWKTLLGGILVLIGCVLVLIVQNYARAYSANLLEDFGAIIVLLPMCVYALLQWNCVYSGQMSVGTFAMKFAPRKWGLGFLCFFAAVVGLHELSRVYGALSSGDFRRIAWSVLLFAAIFESLFQFDRLWLFVRATASYMLVFGLFVILVNGLKSGLWLIDGQRPMAIAEPVAGLTVFVALFARERSDRPGTTGFMQRWLGGGVGALRRALKLAGVPAALAVWVAVGERDCYARLIAIAVALIVSSGACVVSFGAYKMRMWLGTKLALTSIGIVLQLYLWFILVMPTSGHIGSGIGHFYLFVIIGVWSLIANAIRCVSLRPAPIGHCEHCRYNLTGLTEPRCPECGTRFDLVGVARQPIHSKQPLR